MKLQGLGLNKKMAYIPTQDRIITSLHSSSRDGVLKELADLVEEVFPEISRDVVYQCLQEREKMGSTGIGNGVAIPHCHLPALKRVEFFLARSMDGLSFGAYDGRPTYIFFLVLAPESYSLTYLKSLGQLARFLKAPEIRERLLNCRGAGEIINIVNEAKRY